MDLMTYGMVYKKRPGSPGFSVREGRFEARGTRIEEQEKRKQAAEHGNPENIFDREREG